jgi:hypothetical protein
MTEIEKDSEAFRKRVSRQRDRQKNGQNDRKRETDRDLVK